MTKPCLEDSNHACCSSVMTGARTQSVSLALFSLPFCHTRVLLLQELYIARPPCLPRSLKQLLEFSAENHLLPCEYTCFFLCPDCIFCPWPLLGDCSHGQWAVSVSMQFWQLADLCKCLSLLSFCPRHTLRAFVDILFTNRWRMELAGTTWQNEETEAQRDTKSWTVI